MFKSFPQRLLIPLLLCSLGGLIGFGLLSGSWLGQNRHPPFPSPSGPTAASPAVTPIPTPENVARLARQITVRVLGETTSGSGAIVAHQGMTYTVLTCKHVITNEPKPTFNILTHDGQTFPAQVAWVDPTGLDLAVLTFESPVAYPVVTPSPTPAPRADEPVYAAGFPNYIYESSTAAQDTRSWGERAFRLEAGQFKLFTRSLEGGYQLGSTSVVEIGMSGGPLLNAKGELLGINGRAKYPLQGSGAYTYADGGQPAPQLAAEMEALSWAIPISAWQPDPL